MSRVSRDESARAAIEAGDRLQQATTEAERHAAAVDVWQLRLQSFTGHAVWPVRPGVEYSTMLGKLTSAEVMELVDDLWRAHLAGIQATEQAYANRAAKAARRERAKKQGG